ncbi:hypothetical protein GW17_00061605, partial [Ensete ventricosum]
CCPETKGVSLERIEEVFSKGCNGSSVDEDDGVAMANVASPNATSSLPSHDTHYSAFPR